MEGKETIVITDSSDSDDCRVDESRSAPRQAATIASMQQYMSMPLPRMGLPPNRDPRPPIPPEFRHHFPQPNYQARPAPKRMPSPPKQQKASATRPAARSIPAVFKSLGATKDYSNRSVDARDERRCTACRRNGRSCDGGRPCASCFDPGFICTYPDEAAASVMRLNYERQWPRTRDEGSFGRPRIEDQRPYNFHSNNTLPSRTPNYRPWDNTPSIFNGRTVNTVAKNVFSDPLNASIPVKAGERDNKIGIERQSRDYKSTQAHVEPKHDREVDDGIESETDTSDEVGIVAADTQEPKNTGIERIDTTSWLPSSLEEVHKLIMTHEANIKNHREYIVEAQLAGAKVKARHNIHIATEKKGPNPFKKMVGEKPTIVPTRPLPTPLDVKIKPKRGDFANLKVPVALLGDDRVAHIPEYKSIGRLRSTFLARNVHGLKYVPYHAGIEEKDLSQRKHDLETHFKDHSIEEFRRQRECLEMVYQWSDDFDGILSELRISVPQLWKWMSQSTLAKCQKCQTSCVKPPPSMSLDVEITRDEKQRCYWLYEAFMKITKIGMWHFVSPRPGQLEKQQTGSHHEDKVTPKLEHMLCALCFTHNCMTHGSYIDKGMTDDAGEATINDSEEQNNERKRTVLRVGTRTLPHHTCGLYCLGTNFPSTMDVHKILGVDENDELSGLRNEAIKMLPDLGPFHGNKPCANRCFINVEERPLRPNITQATLKDASPTTQQLLRSMSKLYSCHVRLPCMIAKVARLDCMVAFFMLLQTYKDGHSSIASEETAEAQGLQDARKMPPKTGGYNTARSTSLEHRRTWAPCSHDGPCLSGNTNCSCAREQVNCEKSCACSDSCRRRFKGCRCKRKCFLDDRCECYAAHRECDPQLCHDCGVEEVLDPSNKYREDIREGRCRNNRLQLDLPPRTVKGMSEVQGWGLFLGEDLPSNSFVGEYKGENISASESDRRGAIYAYVSQEYLFNLNKENQLDGSRFGNKTRFINNSKAKEFINVFPKVMFVSGVTRIGLFTNRAMKAGEELLYDYGYPADLVKGEFWEKHERAIEHNGVVTPIAKPKFRPRMAKNAVDTPGNEEGEETPVRKIVQPARRKKRKRRVDAEVEDSDGVMETITYMQEPLLDINADSESSEYEESSQGNDISSPGSGAVDESEDELSMPAKPIDRRRGGEAQRRAAQTRKLNKLRGKH